MSEVTWVSFSLFEVILDWYKPFTLYKFRLSLVRLFFGDYDTSLFEVVVESGCIIRMELLFYRFIRWGIVDPLKERLKREKVL